LKLKCNIILVCHREIFPQRSYKQDVNLSNILYSSIDFSMSPTPILWVTIGTFPGILTCLEKCQCI